MADASQYSYQTAGQPASYIYGSYGQTADASSYQQTSTGYAEQSQQTYGQNSYGGSSGGYRGSQQSGRGYGGSSGGSSYDQQGRGSWGGGSGGGSYGDRSGGYGGERGGGERGGGGGSRGGGRGSGYNRSYSGDCDSRGGGGGAEMQEMPDTIFVSGLGEEIEEGQLVNHFGSIGVIKTDKRTRQPKVWIYKDKQSGRPKGEATITYDDAESVKAAINWFNEKEFNSKIIKVEIATRKINPGGMRGGRGGDRGGGGGFGGGRGGGGRGGFGGGDRRGREGGGGGGPERSGDWTCEEDGCGNNNFARRNSCNRCNAPRADGAGSSDDQGFQGRGRGRGFGDCGRRGFGDHGHGGPRGDRGGFRDRGGSGFGDRDGRGGREGFGDRGGFRDGPRGMGGKDRPPMADRYDRRLKPY